MSYIYNLTDTWNAAGTTFAGIKMAVTNTASGASSKLLDLTISGATTGAFSIDKSGNASVSGALTLGTALTVGNGGTGTSTAFTAGSIVFAGASGVYSQNNTKLFWDNTNFRLGVGFSTPAYTFDIIGPNLGATAGDTSLLGRYFSQTGNGESLQILYSRTASSPTNWTTASLILRREVSGTIQQALQFNGDASTTINHSTNELFRVNSNGNVGIATSSPSYPLDVAGTVRGTTALVGNLAALGGYGYTPALQVLGSTTSAASLLMQATASGAFPILTFGNATSGNSGALSSGNTVGDIRFYGGDGTNPIRAAAIAAVVDGAVSTGSMPGRLVFQTTPSGSSTPTERLRITSDGKVLIGTTTAGASKLTVADDSIQINTAKTPASATATGTTGQVCWDASYIYVCTATNTWKRAAIATW